MKLTLNEYSKKYKISHELLKSKIKDKKLDYISEDGEIFIIDKQEPQIAQDISRPKVSVATVINLYAKENRFLKSKIAHLEAKLDRVIEQKEQLLIEERERIEQIHHTKDQQLKNILELVNKKLKLEKDELESQKIETIKTIQSDENFALVELKEYLKTLELSKEQRKIIKRRFLESYDTDERIIQKDTKLYLDPTKYDYGDLIDY
ncbi:MAG: hypothetical protein WC144_02790 [Sulfurimonas sp.]|jgi:hypothetical protein|nr:hypothetical protein [Sulfurimonadaceae bacterium]